MKCLNLNIPQVKKDLNELTQVFNDNSIAYGLLSLNNGYNLDKTPQGDSSKLFDDILKLPEIKGSREKALKLKSKVYTDSFINTAGDWTLPGTILKISTDKNNEPTLNNIQETISELPEPGYTGNDVVFIAFDESEKGKFKRLKQTTNAIQEAVNQGVTAFVTNTKNEVENKFGGKSIRDFFLDELQFDYIEKDKAGFYVKKSPIQEIEVTKDATPNILEVNGININLRDIGIDFTLNKDQLEAVQNFADWTDNKPLGDKVQDVFSLIGNAGTGKTTLVNVFIEYAKNKKKHILASAMTHRAVKVQKSFYGNKVRTETFHSAIGLRGDVNTDFFNAGDIKFIRSAKAAVKYGSILIIDEASMLNNSLYDTLMELKDKEGFKVLFVGDDAQHKPIRQQGTSKVFNSDSKFVKRLDTVERQAIDNKLLTTLNKLRVNQGVNLKPLGNTRTSSVNENNEGIEWVMDTQFNEYIDKIFNSQEFEDQSMYAAIVAYKNATVSKYNKLTRKILGRTQEVEVGEKMVGYATYLENNRTTLMNGADYKVVNKEDTTKILSIPGINTTVEVKGTKVTLQDSMEPVSINQFIVSKYNEPQVFEKLAGMLNTAYNKYLAALGTSNAGRLYAMYKEFDSSFLLFSDLIIPGYFDKKGNKKVYKRKSIDYGYAITSHKSQGGTYKYMFVDETDIDSMYSIDIAATNKSKYVAFSRASDGVIAKTNYEITNPEIGFNFKTVENIDTQTTELELFDETVEALIKDGIVNKTCK